MKYNKFLVLSVMSLMLTSWNLSWGEEAPPAAAAGTTTPVSPEPTAVTPCGADDNSESYKPEAGKKCDNNTDPDADGNCAASTRVEAR